MFFARKNDFFRRWSEKNREFPLFPLGPQPRAPANGQPGLQAWFSFWFSGAVYFWVLAGACQSSTKGTAWAGLLCNPPPFPSAACRVLLRRTRLRRRFTPNMSRRHGAGGFLLYNTTTTNKPRIPEALPRVSPESICRERNADSRGFPSCLCCENRGTRAGQRAPPAVFPGLSESPRDSFRYGCPSGVAVVRVAARAIASPTSPAPKPAAAGPRGGGRPPSEAPQPRACGPPRPRCRPSVRRVSCRRACRRPARPRSAARRTFPT